MVIKSGKYDVLVDSNFVLPQGYRVDVHPTGTGNVYAYLVPRGKTHPRVPLARYILDYYQSSHVIDHINLNTLDNRAENLRKVTKYQNQWNIRKKRGRLLPKGVYEYKGMYYGSVMARGKKYSVKSMQSLDECVRAVSDLRKRVHGRYARD